MLVLRSSPASPFGRKVKIVAKTLGLMERIEIAPTNTADPSDPIRTVNPLGKIPALELEDGVTLFDSRVIVEYLDSLAGGGKVIPTEPSARFSALRLQALCDGICDAALLQVYEVRLRSEDERSAAWADLQAGKVARALASLDDAPPPVAVEIGQIALACALGYLDLRFEGSWRQGHPKLVEWLAAFEAATPAYAETAPH